MSALALGMAALTLFSGGVQAKDPDELLKSFTAELTAAGNDAAARQAASAKVRTQAVEAIKGLDLASVIPAKGYAWAQVASRASEWKVIPPLVDKFLTTNPEPTIKFSALSLGMVGAGYTEDFAAGTKFLKAMEPTTDQQKVQKVSSALNWLGDLYVKNLGVDAAVKEFRSLIAMLPAAAEGNLANSVESIKAAGFGQIADAYVEASRTEEALNVLAEGEAAITNANAKRSLTSKKNQLTVVGKTAPEITVENSLGTWKGGLEKYRGKVVLLDFFAHWCGPCKASFPDLRKTYADLSAQGLEIVHATRFYGTFEQERNLSKEAEFEKMKGFVKQHELAWPVVFVDAKAFESYGVSGIPHMILIDPDGKVVKHKIGYSAQSFAALRADIEATLAKFNSGKK